MGLEHSSNGRHGSPCFDISRPVRNRISQISAHRTLPRNDSNSCCPRQRTETRNWSEDQCRLSSRTGSICWTLNWENVLQVYESYFPGYVSLFLWYPCFHSLYDDYASVASCQILRIHGIPGLFLPLQLDRLEMGA